MNKSLWTVLLAILLVVAGGIGWLYVSLDSVLASAIRTYGPEITGVSVRLESVKIQPVDGVAAVRGLELGNPPGFKTERALSLKNISMTLEVASVTKDVIHIKEILIEQPEITYECVSSGSNLDVIQRHVENYIVEKTAAREEVGTSSSPDKEKRLIIDHFYSKDAKARVSAEMRNGKAASLQIPDLHLTDIGKKSNGASPAEATRQVMGAINQSVTKAVAPMCLGSAVNNVKKGIAPATNPVKSMFK